MTTPLPPPAQPSPPLLACSLAHVRNARGVHVCASPLPLQRVPKDGYEEGDVIHAVTSELVVPTIDLLTAKVTV